MAEGKSTVEGGSEGTAPAGDSTQPLARPDSASSGTTQVQVQDSGGAGAATVKLSGKDSDAPQDGELPIGGVLADRYQILERLSAGGMGVVYKAKHLALDDVVAIKLLLKPQDETDRKRFLLEARLSTKIKHPNTVYISDFGILPDGRSYLVMEFLRGQTLSAAIKSGRMEPLRACRIAVQIARGLATVHDQNIVHRDLKPDNVFLLNQQGQDGTTDFVKIVDFGIAKATGLPGGTQLDLPAAPTTSDGNQTGAVPAQLTKQMTEQLRALQSQLGGNMTLKSAILGTPRYMSPEAIKGKTVDGRADQYSLGCVLFQLLTGRVPFQEDDLMGLLTQHMYEPIPSVCKEVPTVSAELGAIVERLLAKKPEDRYASMRAVEQALDQEVERILVARGERAVISTALAGLLKVQGRGLGATILIRGRAIPLWAMGPLALCLLIGGAWLGVRFLAPSQKEVLDPGEMAELRRRALVVLREAIAKGPEPLQVAATTTMGMTHDRLLIADLEALLGHESVLVRAAAAEALGQFGDRRLVPKLRALLEGGQQPTNVQLGAAISLSRLGDARGTELVSSMLASTSAELQLRAALSQCEHPSARSKQVLQGFLQSSGLPVPVRTSILYCRARSGEGAAVTALRSQAQEGTVPAERIAAQAKLAMLGDISWRDALRDLVDKRGPEHLLAARLTATPEDLRGRPAFRDVVVNNKNGPGVRKLGAEGLGATGELFDARLLGKEMGVAALPLDMQQIFAAGILLIGVHDPALMGEDSLVWAAGVLADGTWLERQAAVGVLGEIKTEESRQLLGRALRDVDKRVRVSAARALGKHVHRATLPVLRPALQDPEREVRVEALRSIAKVSFVLYPSMPDLLPQLHDWLDPLFGSGATQEHVLTLGLYFHMGERQRLADLTALQGAAEPETRLLVLDQLATERSLTAKFLTDPEKKVSLRAAKLLGEVGDRQAIPILKAALSRGGPDALLATGMLARLNQRPSSAAEVVALYDALPPESQAEALPLALSLPRELAKEVVMRAARSTEPEQRLAAAVAASDLPTEVKPSDELRDSRPPGWAILQYLVTDDDVSIRMRAQSLLWSLDWHPREEPTLESAAGHGRVVSQPPDLGAPPPPDMAAPVDMLPPTDLAPAPVEAVKYGSLELQGPSFVQVQLDGQRWMLIPTKATSLSVGTHQVQTMSGIKKVSIHEGKVDSLELQASPIEQAAHDGIELYKKKELDKSLRLLERAYSGCERQRGKLSKPCASIMAEVTYYKAQVLTGQDRPDAAATEYQRFIDIDAKGPTLDPLRGPAKSALEKLSTKLGLVVFKHMTKKGCTEEKQFVMPGNPTFVLAGEERSIRIRARQTVNLGECQ